MIVQVDVEVLSPKCLHCPHLCVVDRMMEISTLSEKHGCIHDFSCAELWRCNDILRYMKSSEGDTTNASTSISL